MKHRIFRLILNLFFWWFVFTFILAIRYYDIGNIAFINLPVEIPSAKIFYNGLILGMSIGGVYTMVEYWLESQQLYNHSVGMIILLRTSYLSVICAILLTAMAIVNHQVDAKQGTINELVTNPLEYIFSATVQFLLAGALIGNLILSIFHTLRSKMGNIEFLNLLIGKYRIPKVENRAFMFLDLRSSTTIAEKLGHKKYSQLIQDCFKDLNNALSKTNAEVYQYVGDEVVLSWPVKSAFKQSNCLAVFFLFKNDLAIRKAYYENEYGLLPMFKAGLNVGEVTVVEVGVMKRSIVYHGDVLNTAARIQAKCNEYGKSILISKAIKENIDHSIFSFDLLGDILLKGKTENVEVFAVNPVETN